MGLLGDEPLPWPEWARPGLQLITCLLLVLMFNTVWMNIAFIRHRWRTCMIISRGVAFFNVLMFFVWPGPVQFALIAQSIANGFSDPALHLASFKRNPQHICRKAFFSLGKLLHHGGGILAAGQMMRPLGLSITATATLTIFDLPWPVAVVLACEAVHWTEDLLVLQRNAPKWLRKLGLPVAAIQTGGLLIMTLYAAGGDKYLYTYTTATMVGNTIDFIGDLIGQPNSTWESAEAYEPVPKMMRRWVNGEPDGPSGTKSTTTASPTTSSKSRARSTSGSKMKTYGPSVARQQHRSFIKSTISGDDSDRRISGGKDEETTGRAAGPPPKTAAVVAADASGKADDGVAAVV